MRQYTNRIRSLLLATLLALTFPLASCDTENGGDVFVPDIPEVVYNADGGFVITQTMLDKRYNEITFPGTHNSFAAGSSFPYGSCQNQQFFSKGQLEKGVRYVELDVAHICQVDTEICVKHGECIGSLYNRLRDIAAFAQATPDQIITICVSDLPDLDGPRSMVLINKYLESEGLAPFIYNWDDSKPAGERVYVPDPWPTLREMFDSGRNVMFLHNRKVGNFGVDGAYYRGMDYDDYVDTNHHPFYECNDIAGLSKVQPVWDPSTCPRQHDGDNWLFQIESHSRKGAAANRNLAARNNDGRKHYQMAKQHEDELLPGNRVVNFITVDFFYPSSIGSKKFPINVVDACNRLNYERFGLDWKSSAYSWELYPHEFDNTVVEHISRTPAIRREVDLAIADFKYRNVGLEGHDKVGNITSWPVHRDWDWWWIPEWAVDDDYCTGWFPNNWPDGVWMIDLGAEREINEIAISWAYPHKSPRYKIFAAGNDAQFQHIRTVGRRSPISTLVQWDVQTFDLGNWRYFRIQIDDNNSDNGPAIYEIKIYGPAN